MLVRGTNGLEIEVEEQIATAMIAAGIVEPVDAADGTEPVEDVEDVEEPESAPAKTKK
ncbi:hypothetical protein [Kytococcus sedentarius]|uniref:hypothetical protein n=1 Tax=Kytococcus sedentarius TaxID=1276 RepID=UPI001364D33F|nr:hypothetical protein [Kytococcus sedentarius]